MNPSGPPTALDALNVGGVPTRGMSGIPLTSGQVFFCDYANGSDGNTGSADSPFKTIYWAYAKCVSGRGDVVVIVSNGLSTGSQRLSVANAQVADSSATVGTLVWAKNNTHLVGMCSNTQVAQRARLAPPTGTYTQATFGSGNFVTVSGAGCIFANLSLFNGFSTGGVSQICWTDTGGRNYYSNVNFGGLADAASAADAASRVLKISGQGENTFDGCVIGLDTVTRSAANASIEFAAGTARNTFRKCTLPFMTSAASVLGILGTGAACMDRWQQFVDCMFINNIKSTSTVMTVLASLTSASPGGLILMKNPTMVGITDFGDANGLANTYVDGGPPVAATTGIAVNPS